MKECALPCDDDAMLPILHIDDGPPSVIAS
jgi:hypothetical protein